MNPSESEHPQSPRLRQVLIVEDDNLLLKTLQAVMKRLPVEMLSARNFQEGLRAIEEASNLAVIVSDHMLPDGEGVELLQMARTKVPSVVRVLMTGNKERRTALQAINRGEIYRFIDKPFEIEEFSITIMQAVDRFALKQENSRLQGELTIQEEDFRRPEDSGEESSEHEKIWHEEGSHWRTGCQSMVDLSLEFLQRIDLKLFIHSHRVARLAVAIARDMGHKQAFLDRIEIAGQLHDIALLARSPSQIQLQRSPEEIEKESERGPVLHHPEASASMVKFIPLKEIIEAIEQHHEYLDGSGYPNQIRGERLSPMAAILGAVDYYEEQASRGGAPMQAMENASGRLFPSEVVRSLVRLFQKDEALFAPEKQMLIQELEPGMKLACSIYTTSGILLIRQGQELNDALITKLKQHESAETVSQTILVEVEQSS